MNQHLTHAGAAVNRWAQSPRKLSERNAKLRALNSQGCASRAHKSLLRELPWRVREFGLRDSLCRLLTEVAFDAFPTAFRRRMRPSLEDICNAALVVHRSAVEFAGSHILASQYGTIELSSLFEEYKELEDRLRIRYRESQQAYPEGWAIGPGTSYLLYALVRAARPETLLETGVANGHSSYFILSALNQNGSGVLHSVDIASDVGCLLRPVEKQRWQLHIFPTRRKKNFDALLQALPPLDLFFHDSDHSYEWQTYELTEVTPHLAEHAIIACDDADRSFAFLDFCGRFKKQPLFLIDADKIPGVLLPETGIVGVRPLAFSAPIDRPVVMA